MCSFRSHSPTFEIRNIPAWNFYTSNTYNIIRDKSVKVSWKTHTEIRRPYPSKSSLSVKHTQEYEPARFSNVLYKHLLNTFTFQLQFFTLPPSSIILSVDLSWFRVGWKETSPVWENNGILTSSDVVDRLFVLVTIFFYGALFRKCLLF